MGKLFDGLVVDTDGRLISRSGQGRTEVVKGNGIDMTGSVVRMSEFESAQEQLRAALVAFAGVNALMDRFGGAEPPVGTVIRWVREFDGRRGQMIVEGSPSGSDKLGGALRFNIEAPSEYVFLAFRAPNGSWQTTSMRGASQRDWDALLKEIGDSKCELASEWADVPAPEKPTAEQLDPIEFAKRFLKKDA
jgi:hypothetical protein